MIPTTATFVGSIICGIAAGVVQGKAEEAVKKKDPQRFPPGLGEYVGRMWKKWRSGEQRGIRHLLSESYEEYKLEMAQRMVAEGARRGSSSRSREHAPTLS